MTLAEFKTIWYMEYAHRTWGRLIGAFFAFPAAYFWYRGHLSRPLKPRVLIYGTLIGIQGLMGWYMVKSGLENRFHEPDDVPRVSQYRLAAHLALSFFLYANFLWSALNQLLPAQALKTTANKASLRFRYIGHATKGMVFFTALSGVQTIIYYNDMKHLVDFF